jgi:uncharacterized iron-regulated protein
MRRHVLAFGLAAFPLSVVADEDAIAAFRDAEIIVLGEIHDNPEHHVTQARIVAALQPDALVFEMIEAEQALAITPDVRNDADELEALLDWEESGWPDFAMYFPIFAAAPDAAIFGAEVPTDEVRRSVEDGAAAVFGDAAGQFGLDQPLDPEQLALRLQLQQDAHCGAMPDSLLPGMVEAQRLRDAALAEATVAAFEHARLNDDAPQVVVITGNGHAREDWGAPALLRSYYGEGRDVDIRTLGQFEGVAPYDAPFTRILAADPADRPDPCETFR